MVVAKNTLPSLRELLVFLVFTSGSSALSGRPRGVLSICRYFTYLIHFFEFIQFLFSQENENIRSLPFLYVRRRLTGAQSRVSSDSYVVTPRNIRRPGVNSIKKYVCFTSRTLVFTNSHQFESTKSLYKFPLEASTLYLQWYSIRFNQL